MNINKTIVRIITFFSLSLLFINTAMAAYLGSNTNSFAGYDLSVANRGPLFGGAPPGLYLTVIYSTENDTVNVDELDNYYAPFGSIAAQSVGEAYTVDIGTEYIGASELLTNGTDDFLGRYYSTFDYMYGNHDSNVFMHNESLALTGIGLSSPDFNGYLIEKMELTITNFSNWYWNEGAEVWAFDDVTYQVEYFGKPVPVPNAIWLFATGLISLVGIKRKVNRE